METKKVEFENGNAFLVASDGVVKEMPPEERFFELLKEEDFAVEKTTSNSPNALFVGQSGKTLLGTAASTTIQDVAERAGVEIAKLWPTYDGGDDTELSLYVRVQAVE